MANKDKSFRFRFIEKIPPVGRDAQLSLENIICHIGNTTFPALAGHPERREGSSGMLFTNRITHSSQLHNPINSIC